MRLTVRVLLAAMRGIERGLQDICAALANDAEYRPGFEAVLAAQIAARKLLGALLNRMLDEDKV